MKTAIIAAVTTVVVMELYKQKFTQDVADDLKRRMKDIVPDYDL